MTQGDDKKPPKPDPFAPLPLSETLTGKTKRAPEPAPPAPEPAPPQPPPAAPLPPTAFTARVTGEHEAPVAAFDASAYEAAAPEPAPVYEAAPEEPLPDEPVPDEPAWTEPAALAAPAPAAIVVENELRDAIGVTQIPDEKAAKKKKRRASTDAGDGDEDGDRPPRKLWMLVVAFTVMVGGGITAMVLVGRSNSERFLIACEADRVVIEQGRSFPPWGESSLDGAEWKSLKIPPEAPCTPFETRNKSELAARFFKILEERATTLVGGSGNRASPTTSSGQDDPVGKVDEAEADLEQALLVARSIGGDAAIDARGKIERLLGDVTYWRASARLRTAADALTDAAKQFDAAATQNPRTHRDAESWSTHTRKLAEDLRAGPEGVKASEFPPMPSSETRPMAPAGVALPVEPVKAGSAAEPAPPVDAGVTSGGGVLL